MPPSFRTAFVPQAGVEGCDDEAPERSTNPLQALFYLMISDIDNTPAANNQAVCKAPEVLVGSFASSFGLPGTMFFSQVDTKLLTGYIKH